MSDTQIRTAHLFYAITLNAAAVSLFGLWGILVAGFVLLVWWQILASARREACEAYAKTVELRRRDGNARVELLTAGALCVLVVGLLLPGREGVDPKEQAKIAMQVVAKAVAEYEAEYGVLPGEVGGSDERVPISWRTAILKNLEEEKLAATYDVEQAWDSDVNRRLLDYRPWFYQPFYHSGSDDPPPRELTPLHLVRYDDGFWIVEDGASMVPWTSPDGMTPEQWKCEKTLPDVGEGFWRIGFLVSTYRGRLAVSDKAAITLLPGESLPDPQRCMEGNHVERSITVVHYGNIARLIVFLAVVLYPVRWLHRISGSVARHACGSEVSLSAGDRPDA